MTLIRAVIAAAVLILPGAAFAAANETPAAPERAATEQVSTAEADRAVAQDTIQDTARDTAQDTVQEAGRESEALARAPATRPAAPPRPKAVRSSKLSVVRAAPAPHSNWGCSGYWCGRQIVLMLGVGY